jgi:phosphoribosylamine--glycine ligase
VITEEVEKEILQKVFLPIVKEFKELGQPFKGFLYAGIMMTQKGFRVLEFNVRLGDPEAQAILPRLENDFLELILASVDERLTEMTLRWKEEDCVCVVIASGGYPDEYETGKKIAGISSARENPDIQVFHAGTKRVNGELLTAGGRVLNVVGSGRSMFEALSKTYSAVDKIFFDNMVYRKDIGSHAAKTLKQ